MRTRLWNQGLLALELNNTTFAGLGDATGLRGSAAAGNLYMGLARGYPGRLGDQTTNEADYGGYARVAVPRGSWTIGANEASLSSPVSFPKCTGGTNVLTHVTIGTAQTGAGKLLYAAPIGISGGMFAFNNGTMIAPSLFQATGESLVGRQIIAYQYTNMQFQLSEGTVYWISIAGNNLLYLSSTSNLATPVGGFATGCLYLLNTEASRTVIAGDRVVLGASTGLVL